MVGVIPSSRLTVHSVHQSQCSDVVLLAQHFIVYFASECHQTHETDDQLRTAMSQSVEVHFSPSQCLLERKLENDFDCQLNDKRN